MDKKKLTKEDWKLIRIAIEAMKDTYSFIRGFGKIGKEESRFDELLKKIDKL